MGILAEGAEAVIYRKNGTIIKQRKAKGYRLKELDERLRKFRTRREAKVLEKLQELGFPAPFLKSFSEKTMDITMDFVQGRKLRDVLHNAPEKYGRELGKKLAMLHTHNIIHGDLTTSNIIAGKHLILIDFGLSSFSDKIEDKAVDLHLLQKSLESTHSSVYRPCFSAVLKAYQKGYAKAKDVFSRLEDVNSRGRNKKHLKTSDVTRKER